MVDASDSTYLNLRASQPHPNPDMWHKAYRWLRQKLTAVITSSVKDLVVNSKIQLETKLKPVVVSRKFRQRSEYIALISEVKRTNELSLEKMTRINDAVNRKLDTLLDIFANQPFTGPKPSIQSPKNSFIQVMASAMP